jgi:EmrB/QacA subfamily drug resistance transporter
VLVVCLAQFMVILDVSIVNVALPSIKQGLGFSTTSLQWVVNAYTITFAGFLLLGGRAADLLGSKRVFVAGTVAFAVCSLGCAVAASRGTLLGARALQGLAGAALSPATLSILTTSTREGTERNRALAAWGAIGGLGASSGAILGGLLTQTFGWEAIFAINVPLGALVVALGLRFIPASQPRDVAAERHFDATGAVLVTAGLATLTYGIVRTSSLGWSSPGVLGPLGAGLALVAGFLAVERFVARWPLMPLSIFRIAAVRWANLVVLLLYAGLFAMFFFLTLYLQQIRHHGAFLTGIAFLPTTLSVFTGSTLAPRLAARFGLRLVLAGGMVTSTVGLLWLAGIDPNSAYLSQVLPGEVLSGLGMGIALVSGTVAAMSGVPSTQSGLASGLLNTARLIGGALGLAALSAVAAAQTHSDAAAGVTRSLTNGYALAFAVGAAFTAAGALVALALLRPARAKVSPVLAEARVQAEIGSEVAEQLAA